jgi:hypothetical protein
VKTASGRTRTFHASYVELEPDGWISALGCWKGERRESV